MQLNLGHLLFENSIADDGPEESVANILIFLILIHEAAQEYREIDNIQEECLNGHFEDLQLQSTFL